MLLAAVLACVGQPAPTGTLLMVSERDGAPATWVIDADGSGLRRLAGPVGSTFPGEADPQGTHALVVSALDPTDGPHREQLWLLPLDGSDAVALSPPAGKIRNPSWSEDGTWLAFESDAVSYRDLFRVDRDGSNRARLTDAPHGSFEPDVSKRIAFGTSRDGNAEIYTMTADGADVRRLTEDPSDDVHPRWSADGEQLAWLSRRSGRPQVFVSDGHRSPRPLRPANPDAVDLDLAWSPSGDLLAVTVQTGKREVFIEIVEVATGDIRATLDGDGPDEHPAWSPDGAWIAFSSSREGDPAVFVSTPQGTLTRRLGTGGVDWLPRWLNPAIGG